MTVEAGYPDFQAYPAWRGTPLGSGTGAPVVIGTPIHVNASITNWAGLIIEVANLGSSAGGVTVQFTNGKHIDVWVVLPNQSLCVFAPVLGTGGAVNISTAQAGTQNVTYAVTPTNLQIPEYDYVRVGQAIRRLNVAVAASTTDGSNYPHITGGIGYLFYEPSDASGQLSITLQELSEAAATVTDIYTATMPAVANQPTVVTFHVPAASYQLAVHNNDAAAPHSYNAYVNIGE